MQAKPHAHGVNCGFLPLDPLMLRRRADITSADQCISVSTSISSYTPELLTWWTAGDEAWSDRTSTWKDLGDYGADRFDFKYRTSVANRQASYTLTSTCADKLLVVMVAEAILTSRVIDDDIAGVWYYNCPRETLTRSRIFSVIVID